MESEMNQLCQTVWSCLFDQTEFWSAIIGAIVGATAGGLIAYMVQMMALREGRKQRKDDYKQSQQSLGNALLFEMMRIHSNLKIIHDHIESRFAEAELKKSKEEPWQFYLPIANHPDPVHFTSEEMVMIFSLNKVDVLNALLPMDDIHNSIIQLIKVLDTERASLTS